MSLSLKPEIRPRSAWGARTPDISRMKRHEIRFITLHHSGIVWNGDIPTVERIRHLEDFSLNEKNWPDIPYHFKIDLDGAIYECRSLEFCGETNTTYDPTGHALICVMGNFEEQKITKAQQDSLVRLCAWICREFDVSPATIRGHKDYAETLCPGKDFYPMIADGTIRRRVEDLLREHS